MIDDEGAILETDEKTGRKSLTWPPPFDPEMFKEHVADIDISEEKKDEMLRCLFAIMVGFVELGHGIDSVQMILAPMRAIASDHERNLVNYNQLTNKMNFKKAAASAAKDE